MSARPLTLVVCPNHGPQTCGCYRCNEWDSVEVVRRADAETLARAVSASLTHGEKGPLEAALTVYLSKHPWSDL